MLQLLAGVRDIPQCPGVPHWCDGAGCPDYHLRLPPPPLLQYLHSRSLHLPPTHLTLPQHPPLPGSHPDPVLHRSGSELGSDTGPYFTQCGGLCSPLWLGILPVARSAQLKDPQPDTLSGGSDHEEEDSRVLHQPHVITC